MAVFQSLHPERDMAATNLVFPSLYPYAERDEHITLKRSDLERQIRITLEEAMEEGGVITELSCDCMHALDRCARHT
jgi:hypothetical protein